VFWWCTRRAGAEERATGGLELAACSRSRVASARGCATAQRSRSALRSTRGASAVTLPSQSCGPSRTGQWTFDDVPASRAGAAATSCPTVRARCTQPALVGDRPHSDRAYEGLGKRPHVGPVFSGLPGRSLAGQTGRLSPPDGAPRRVGGWGSASADRDDSPEVRAPLAAQGWHRLCRCSRSG